MAGEESPKHYGICALSCAEGRVHDHTGWKCTWRSHLVSLKPKLRLAPNPNNRWSMDFVADTFGASLRLRILAINDDACGENLCLLGATSISDGRVAHELDTLVRLCGKPACIVTSPPPEVGSKP